MAGKSNEDRQSIIGGIIGFIIGILAGAAGNILSQSAQSAQETILFQLINSIPPVSYLVFAGIVIIVVLIILLSRRPISWKMWRVSFPWMSLGVAGILLGASLMFYGPALLHSLFPPDTGIRTSVVQGELIGVSDGHAAFDTKRLNGEPKNTATEFVRAGKNELAKSYWDVAVKFDERDAEAKIYLEDECILGIKLPQTPDDPCVRRSYVTLVVAAPLSGDPQTVDIGRDILQGAYVAQREYNALHPDGPQVYLLIASIGSSALPFEAQSQVAEQIKLIAQNDRTFVGVVGLPFGSENLMTTLSQSNIPVISIASLATDEIPYIPYLRSVAPSFRDEAMAVVKYVSTLNPSGHVAVVHAAADRYSDKLNSALRSLDPDRFVDIPYTGGSEDSLNDVTHTIQASNADIVYFTGFYEDARILQIKLRSLQRKVQILSGDITYEWVHAPSEEMASFVGLYFVAFAFPDLWSIQHVPGSNFPFYSPKNSGLYVSKPPVIVDYADAFDPEQVRSTQKVNLYTYGRADQNVHLAYDATALLLQATCSVLGKECDSTQYDQQKLLPEEILKGLHAVSISQTFQGISGQISYSENSSAPQQKAVLILQIGPRGTQCVQIAGGRYQPVTQDKKASNAPCSSSSV